MPRNVINISPFFFFIPRNYSSRNSIIIYLLILINLIYTYVLGNPSDIFVYSTSNTSFIYFCIYLPVQSIIYLIIIIYSYYFVVIHFFLTFLIIHFPSSSTYTLPPLTCLYIYLPIQLSILLFIHLLCYLNILVSTYLTPYLCIASHTHLLAYLALCIPVCTL